MSEKMHVIGAFICLYHCGCTYFPLQESQCAVPGVAEAALLSTWHILCCSNGDILPPCCCELNLGWGSGLQSHLSCRTRTEAAYTSLLVCLVSQVQCCCSSLQKPSPLLSLTLVVKLTAVKICNPSAVLGANTPLLQHQVSLEIMYINLLYNRRCCALKLTEVAALSKHKHRPSPFPVSPAASPIPHVYICW